MNRLTSDMKSLVERSLGVTISRGPRTAPNKHSDNMLRGLRDWSSRDVVFDVGANDGRTILRILNQLSSPRIFAFEPVASTYRTLVEQTGHLANVRHFQCALGEKVERKEIYVNEISAMSSFFPDWGTAVASETVEVKTVDETMAEEGVDFIHYLKIDTEGYELEVLRGAQEALCSSRIAIVQVEVGLGQTSHEFATLEQVRQYLAPMGYVVYGIFNQCHAPARVPESLSTAGMIEKAVNVLVYFDALFVRADVC